MAESPPQPPTTAVIKPKTTTLNHLINLDTTWSLNIHQICQPIPRSLLKLLEISGDGRLWFPIPISLLLTPAATKSPPLQSLLTSLLIGLLLDILLIGLIKFTVKRPRPVYNKGMHLTVAVDHWSFPSGHSSRVCFIASLLYLSGELLVDCLVQLGYDGKFAEYIAGLVCIWALITSLSRVLLGRHFVFDVIAGACLGVVNSQLVLHLL